MTSSIDQNMRIKRKALAALPSHPYRLKIDLYKHCSIPSGVVVLKRYILDWMKENNINYVFSGDINGYPERIMSLYFQNEDDLINFKLSCY